MLQKKIWMLYIHACCKQMFQVFSGVSYICLQVFHLDVANVCNCFQIFLGVFTSVSDSCFKCFIYLILYVATIIYTCFKCRSGVAHGMCIKSGGWRGRRLGGVGDVWSGAGDVWAAWAHCWCAHSRARRARRSLAPYVGTVRTLLPGSDVQALASPLMVRAGG
jgi:hypothetical protein